MKYAKNTTKLRPRLLIAILVAVLVVAAGGAFAYTRYVDDSPVNSNKQDADVDLSPATEEDQKESDKAKEDSADKDDQTPAPGSKSVTPVIVDASQYGDAIEVRSYIGGIVENGGACSIKFARGSMQFTKQVAATADATTTRCTNLSVNRSEFSEAGEWVATVTYSSSTAQGISQARTFEVK